MPGKRSTTQRARPAARSLLPLLLAVLNGCEACKPDETLAEIAQPRRARLVRQHKLGRWFENVKPTVLVLDGVEQQYEACEGSAGEAELYADASGTVFVFRCQGQPWKVARVVAEQLFPDCPPSGTTAEQILAAAPNLQQAAVECCVAGRRLRGSSSATNASPKRSWPSLAPRRRPKC